MKNYFCVIMCVSWGVFVRERKCKRENVCIGMHAFVFLYFL